MSKFETLPVLLVSSKTETEATSVVLELIDNDVTEEYNTSNIPSSDRVWRLVNKYYSADVRVHVLTDGGSLDLDLDSVEAHIIHITKQEVEGALGEQRAAARAGASGGAWARAHVRVLLADADDAGAAPLAAWAAAQRAEPVARRPAARAARAGPFAEPAGVAHARAALHAHAWRGMRRPATNGFEREMDSGSSSDSEREWQRRGSGPGSAEDSESDESRAVERAEAFAAALGALGAHAQAQGAAAHEPDALRRRRAEQLLAAFCRALGLDPASV